MDLETRIADLRSDSASRREQAAESLAQAGEAAAPAAVALIRVLDDGEPVSAWAVAALENLGPPPLNVLPALRECLNQDSSLALYWTVTLIGRLEDDGATLADELINVGRRVQDLAVQQRCLWALKQIGATSPSVVAWCTEVAQQQEPRSARLAQQVLAQIAERST